MRQVFSKENILVLIGASVIIASLFIPQFFLPGILIIALALAASH